ncbi:MAG: 2-keto-4-pentenoate hydratase [Ilumatobacteraceae bacterium]|nr:2-keto-4-pentenoate hydratase [Ilumatobacteraceae bacterium]
MPIDVAHEQAAQRLIDAAAGGAPCDPIRDLFPAGTIDDGYAVQQLVIERTRVGARRVGRKIGLTSAAVQQQMGVSTPDFGVLFADMAIGDAEPVPRTRLLQPRVEAEVAFVLKRDLPDRPVITSDVLRATDFVVAAIEIVDSRIKDWSISIVDTVGDNASSGMFVLGGTPRRLRDIDDLRACEMSLVSSAGETVSAGLGAACLGSPINAVVWLANAVAERGAPLQAGEVILSGSLGPLVTVQRGLTYEATITGLGSVRASFEA